MSKAKNDAPNQFVALVQQHYHKLQLKYKGVLCLIFPMAVLSGLTFGSILEYYLYLPASVKVGIGILLLISMVAGFMYLKQDLPLPSFKEYYRVFSRQYHVPELSDALDLYRSPDSERSDIHQVAIRQNFNRLDYGIIDADLSSFSRTHRITKYFKIASLVTTAVLVAFAGFISYQPESVNRLVHFWYTYSPPNPYQYAVKPGSVTIERGEMITPHITFKNQLPNNLTLAFKTEIESQFRERKATSTEGDEVSFTSIPFSTNGSYYFVMDGFESQKYPITVQLRPRFEHLNLKVIPPKYTGLDTSRYSYPFSKLEPFRGSEIVLSAKTNKPVNEVILHHKHTKDSIALIQDTLESSVQHRWTVSNNDSLSFSLTDSAGLANENRFNFIIEPIDDRPPSVTLLEPSQNLRVQTPEDIQLRYEAGDDFGLTKASLNIEIKRAFSEEVHSQSIALPVPSLNTEEIFNWALPELNLQPRDILTYWIEVADNDALNGSKSGRSQKRTVTISSMTEYLDELESKEEGVDGTIDKLSESFDQMQQEYEQFKEQLIRDSENKWEQQQNLDQVEQQRKEIEDHVNDLNKKFEELRNDIQKNQTLDSETMQAYDELQKLMKDINDPELAKALKELQNSLDQVNQEKMRKALDNFEFNEELYRERIERTKELFKSLKLNSDLEKMASALDKLSDLEQEISESTDPPSEDLKKQKAVQEDLSEIQNQLDKLQKNAAPKNRRQLKSLQKTSEQQIQDIQKEIADNMKRLEQSSSSKKDEEIQQQQQNIQQKLQQMSEQMRDSKQQLNQQQKQVNGAALRYILYSLLNLSTKQEELAKETDKLPPRSQVFVEKAREEQNISKQFTKLSDSLYQVSAEIPSFSNQINKRKHEVEEQLKQAVDILSERNKSNAVFAQKQSLGGINDLVSMIANLLEQLQSQQGGGSGGAMSMQQLMEQMQQMSGHQQKINQQIQNMINDMQGDRLTNDQMERLNQMSRQQNKIRRQMRELQRNGNLESGDKVLSELERMSEEMEDGINDMRGGQLNKQLVQRQQNILSRMLNAEDAVQKRGEEERREATTAQEQPQSSPPDVTLEELQQKIRKMINDPERTQFTEDYQRLIEQYFELLKDKRIPLENRD